jgi:hypothetical protein
MLSQFDGQSTQSAVAAVMAEHEIDLDDHMLRRLLDLGLLVDTDKQAPVE